MNISWFRDINTLLYVMNYPGLEYMASHSCSVKSVGSETQIRIYMLFSVVHMIFYFWCWRNYTTINTSFHMEFSFLHLSSVWTVMWYTKVVIALKKTPWDNHYTTILFFFYLKHWLSSIVMETATISGDWILRILHNVQCFTVNDK